MSELMTDNIPTKVPRHQSRPTPLKFAAWHLPRKQFIRKYQWCQQIEAILSDIGDLRDRPLRYLTLPGNDLLDLRVLRDLCVSRAGLTIKALGFDVMSPYPRTSDYIRQSIVSNELRSRGIIAPGSYIYNEDFHNIANNDSVAYKNMTQFGSFDVVNLDFCDSFLNKKYIKNHQALYNVIDYQTMNRHEPWLLFVTTTIETAQPIREYGKMLQSNIENNDIFGSTFKSEFSFTTADQPEFGKWLKGLGPELRAKLFSLGLGKWLLSLLAPSPNPWHVRMLESYMYGANYGKSCNLLALGFRVDPFISQRIDRTGIVKTSDQRPLNEHELAISLLERCCGISDLDRLLEADVVQYQRWLDESASLLEEAGYDRADYLRWIERTRSPIMRE